MAELGGPIPDCSFRILWAMRSMFPSFWLKVSRYSPMALNSAGRARSL